MQTGVERRPGDNSLVRRYVPTVTEYRREKEYEI